MRRATCARTSYMAKSTDSEARSSHPLPPPWDRIFSLSTKLVIYGLLFGLLYLLRPFFLLVFLTFVCAYILEHGVQGLSHRIPNRPIRVILVAVVFLGSLISAGLFLAPPFARQAQDLAKNYPKHLEAIDTQIESLREVEFLKGSIVDNMTAKDLIGGIFGIAGGEEPSGKRAELVKPKKEEAKKKSPKEEQEEDKPESDTSPTEQDPDALQGPVAPGPYTEELSAEERASQVEHAIGLVKNIASPILGIGSAFLLSLLFSFLIVLDLPKLSRAIAGLHETKLSFIYDEVAENIRDFGLMLGRALEAQLFIAFCNTILTAIGLYFLGLTSNIVFLSAVVFFCSFIPVAGVFISSTPICIEALAYPDGGGVSLMFLAIVLILVIHFIEAYFLNPKIFGHHLHMNAVMVLIVLTIGGKLFGVWGLVLGLPVVNYFFGHAIRRRPKPGEEDGDSKADGAGHPPPAEAAT